VSILRRQKKQDAFVRVYYASDVHGSDVLWRKFLNAAKHYECSALIMGGDLMGKAVVPIVRNNGAYTAWVIGEERHATTPEELEEMERAIRMNGFYAGTPGDARQSSRP
jgi:uncharacterized protein